MFYPEADFFVCNFYANSSCVIPIFSLACFSITDILKSLYPDSMSFANSVLFYFLLRI